MTNSAERLFDQVLSQLPAPPEEPEIASWKDHKDEVDDQLDPPPDTDDGELFPLEVEARLDLIADDLTGTLSVFEPADTKDMELIEGGIRTRGFEAIAFYKSRRFIDRAPFSGKWGIFCVETREEKTTFVVARHNVSQVHGTPFVREKVRRALQSGPRPGSCPLLRSFLGRLHDEAIDALWWQALEKPAHHQTSNLIDLQPRFQYDHRH